MDASLNQPATSPAHPGESRMRLIDCISTSNCAHMFHTCEMEVKTRSSLKGVMIAVLPSQRSARDLQACIHGASVGNNVAFGASAAR